MKQLKQLVLFISCLFLLQIVQGSGERTVSSVDKNLHTTALHTTHSFYKQSLPRFSYRTKALNDFHEQCFFVSSIRIKPLYVFIRSHYKGYTQSYISVAIALNQWRGPPTA